MIKKLIPFSLKAFTKLTKMTSYKEKLNHITTFIFDVDGVLTDGSVALHSEELIRTLNSKDGYAMQFAHKSGYRLIAITGGNSIEVKKRLTGLGFDKVILSAKNKVSEYKKVKMEFSFEDQEVLYMGDDIPDYQVMKIVGVATCPQDASPEIKSISDYQSPYLGGSKCARDVIEQTLRVQGKWFTELAFEW